MKGVVISMKKIGLLLVIGMMILTAAGCGKKESGAQGGSQEEAGYKNDVSTESLVKAVSGDFGENYWPDMPLDADMLENIAGLTADDYDEFAAEMPMISTNVDTLIIVKAKDGASEKVKQALTGYQDSMKNDSLQYPMNVPKIQASKIDTFGNYVCYVQLGADTTAAGDESEDAVIKYCEAVNQKALDIIEGKLKK